jgi:hypothetical protein
VSKRGSSGCTVKYSKSSCRLASKLLKWFRKRNDEALGDELDLGDTEAKKYDI